MRLAILGLGRMGANMARRLHAGGHEVVVYNRTEQVSRDLAAEAPGIQPAFSLEDVVRALQPPRVLWTMFPAGEVTEKMILQLADLASKGDVFIDGGNANFNDSLRRANVLSEKGFHFIDAGVSGGIWGLKEGYSLMLGGEEDVIASIRPIFETLAPGKDLGWGRVGPHGAGHFTKMVHNGIEYGMMEALAEGFDIMRGRKDMNLDLHQVARVWQNGSVVRSWLLDLAERALAEDPELKNIGDWVDDSGEGRWTVQAAIDEDVPAPVITLSLFQRFISRREESFAGKMLAALRNQFGGHAIHKTEG
jgi:6-phosphogluconate dehydrogenase